MSRVDLRKVSPSTPVVTTPNMVPDDGRIDLRSRLRATADSFAKQSIVKSEDIANLSEKLPPNATAQPTAASTSSTAATSQPTAAAATSQPTATAAARTNLPKYCTICSTVHTDAQADQVHSSIATHNATAASTSSAATAATTSATAASTSSAATTGNATTGNAVIGVNNVNVSLSDTDAAAAAAQVKNDVSKMDISEKIKYLYNDGKKIANDAFTKVKDNVSLKNDEKLQLEKYTTILQIQKAEQKMKEEIEKLEEEIKTAPETSLKPANSPKLKGAISQNLRLLKESKERLQPVLDILKLKIKASNTLSTLAPLKNEYENLQEKEGDGNPEVKRQEVVLNTALRQYAQEIKDVIQIDQIIADPATGKPKTKKTDGALFIINDAELEIYRDTIQLIIDALDGTASSKPLLSKNGTALANWSKQDPGTIGVVVPTIKGDKASLSYYQMVNGKFSQVNEPIDKVHVFDRVVNTKLTEAYHSAKDGTKVVQITYKGEPLIVSMDISRPYESYQKADQNMLAGEIKETIKSYKQDSSNNGFLVKEDSLKRSMALSPEESQKIKEKIEKEIKFVKTNTKVPQKNKETLRNMIEHDQRMQAALIKERMQSFNENKFGYDVLKALSPGKLNEFKEDIQKEIARVNTNTKVSAENKEKLKEAIQKTKLEPIKAEIAKRAASKGGFTAKKSKKNNKTKKSTRRSS